MSPSPLPSSVRRIINQKQRVCARVRVAIIKRHNNSAKDKDNKRNIKNAKCLDAGVKLQVCGLSQPALRAKWAIPTRSTRDTIDKQNKRKVPDAV